MQHSKLIAPGQSALHGTVASSVAVISGYVVKCRYPDMPGEVVGAVSITVAAIASALITIARQLVNHYLHIGLKK